MTDFSSKKHIENFPCPKCSSSGKGKSAARYALSDGKEFWSCYDPGCPTKGKPQFEDKSLQSTGVKSNSTAYRRQQQNYLTREEVTGFPVQELKTRGITKETAAYFGIRTSVNEITGEVDTHYYPYYIKKELAGYKVRMLPKQWKPDVGSTASVDPFGWNKIKPAKKLIITEGECDACIVYQVLNDHCKQKGYSGIPQVVSMANGAGSVKALLKSHAKTLSKYAEIILCFDEDEEGQKAINDFTVGYDGLIKVMKLDHPDANEAFLEEGPQPIIDSFYSAEEPRLGGMVFASDILNEVRESESEGKPYKWDMMTVGPMGLHFPEVSLWISGTGSGKTDIMCENVDYWLANEDFRIAVHSLEMTRGSTLARILSKRFGMPDLDGLSDSEYEKLINTLPEDYLNKLLIFDTKTSELSVDISLRLIKQEILASGATLHIIDNLTCLTEGLANEKQAIDTFIKECKALTMQYGIAIIVIMHLNRPKDGGDFEGGVEAGRNNLYGSASPLKKADTALLLTRNQDHSDPAVRNTTICKWIKNRNDKGRGTVGSKFALSYDPKTTRISETDVVDIIEKKDEGEF